MFGKSKVIVVCFRCVYLDDQIGVSIKRTKIGGEGRKLDSCKQSECAVEA